VTILAKEPRRISRNRWLLIAPAVALYSALLVGPLGGLIVESFHGQEVNGGFAGSLDAYRDLASGGFGRVLLDTLRISVIASLISVAAGFLVARHLARHCSPRMRVIWTNVIVSILFLSLLIRIYALALTFGPAGLMPYLALLLNIRPTSRALTECLVVMGLLNFTMPFVTLSLVGVIENINPRLNEAAQSLGAPGWRAFLTTDLTLALPSVVSIAAVAFSLCISAFLIPLILGRGFVLFLANLIYVRSSEILDFQTGSAMAVTMLLLTMALIYGLQRVARGRQPRQRSAGK
jgi:ABC-type spermidine/putrescine transport system permease subunit I